MLAIIAGCCALRGPAFAQCPPSVPAEGAALPGPLPVFPTTNWWNTDVSSAPVDPGSANFIAFINNGGTRHLHPDFGGEVSPGSVGIYGMPYAVVDGTQAKQAITFQYWDESDGVNYQTHQGIPFYPIPAAAIVQPHWVEGGEPGNVDLRSQADRHLLLVDCTNRFLYELYNVWYDAGAAKWRAGSGAFFDMNANDRRPDTWTSADAAGLAIFPGLVRYDEAWDPAVKDIGHAFRVTVRSTNGYVYPASHRAGSTSGALPMGARLRLKANVGGLDPALRTSDANVRKIFRAMQKYGLIVADNGSDMYITGTFDKRWNNGILNPGFSLLSASDFEVITLGWTPVTYCTGNSTTNANLVEQYYVSILNRPSDAGGKAYWISEADRLCALGADPKQTFFLLANTFFNSPEYNARNRDDTGFVIDLYTTFFNRAPDSGGSAYWVQQIAAGLPRNIVMSAFLFSPEFAATMNAAFPGQSARAETYLALNLFGGFFRRLADSGGYNYWDGQLRTAQCSGNPAAAVQATIDAVSSQFVASAEYGARNTTNSQFVEDLYYAMLQRGGDLAGFDFWVGQLGSGALTRSRVRQQFLVSPEMQAQSAAIAAQGCLP